MKAFFATRYGGLETMRFGDLPDPVPGRGEVLLAVRASSVNPVDFKVRLGMTRPLSGSRFPRVLGTDIAGVVEALGPGVSGWQPGDRVYGAMGILRGDGGHAQKAVAPAESLRRMPEGLSFEHAAALPVAALTALNGVRMLGDLAGRRVLVNGATGGVGHFALQIARARGAKVAATCSARNADLAQALGAEEVLDYRAQPLPVPGRTWDAIYDAHGGLARAAARASLAPGGRLATPALSPSIVLRALAGPLLGPRLRIGNLRALPEDYAELEALLATGAVRPVIEQVFPLAEAAKAFAVVEEGRVRGKVVIRVDGAAAQVAETASTAASMDAAAPSTK